MTPPIAPAVDRESGTWTPSLAGAAEPLVHVGAGGDLPELRLHVRQHRAQAHTVAMVNLNPQGLLPDQYARMRDAVHGVREIRTFRLDQALRGAELDLDDAVR